MDIHTRLLWLVVALATATAVAMALLWPPSSAPRLIDAVPLLDGRITAVEVVECPVETFVAIRGECQLVDGIITSAGVHEAETFDLDTAESGYPPFEVGDRVKLQVNEFPNGDIEYFVTDFERLRPLLWLFVLFVVAILALGRWHGLRSLFGLGLSLLVVTEFIVPAILAGSNPFTVAIAGAMAIMLITLYLAHGFNVKTTAAVIGTAAALLVTVVLGLIFVRLSELTGLSSEDAQLALSTVAGLDLRGLVLAGLVIGALGVLDDVTVSQASTVFAVYEADPSQSYADLLRRALSVGRDHIASTVNTLVLAYAGASMPLLILIATGGLSTGDIINSELVAEEIVKTLVGSIGLVSAVPLTTALAAAIAVRQRGEGTLEIPEHLREDADLDSLTEEERDARRWSRYMTEIREEDGGTRDDGPNDGPNDRPNDEPQV